MTFAEYVGFYGLARSEGLVLRYLADAYKALRQTVPDEAKTEELTDLIEWLGELVRQVDSSLLDEWEQLRNPVERGRGPARTSGRPRSPANTRAFRVLVRNALFRRVELAALRPLRRARRAGRGRRLGRRRVGGRAGAVLRRARRHRHRAGRARPGDADHRRAAGHAGLVRQIFDDPAGDHDWGISAAVDLAASDEAGAAVLRVTDVGQL